MKSKKIFGIIGDPVKHSLSPQMHNAAFKSLGIDAEYQLFHVKENELPRFFERMRAGEIWGVNVTLPHKQSVGQYLDHITPLAQEIGAVNLVVHKNNELYGDNTDGPGYLASLVHDTHFDSKHENIVVIGAGGASHAICHILCDNGAETLTIINRNQDHANELLASLKALHKSTQFHVTTLDNPDKKLFSDCHLLINTTSLGMNHNPWSNLDFFDSLNKSAIVSDIVYTPKETAFIAKAKSLGHHVHYGDSMLLYQGVITFERFTDHKAPLEIMKNTLDEILK